MLDRLFLRYLTKKGKVAYWVGQVLLAVLWFLYVTKVSGQSLNDGGETTFIIGVLGIIVGWGFICLMLFKKPKEEKDQALSNKI